MAVRLLTRLFRRAKLKVASKRSDECISSATEQQLQEQRELALAQLTKESITEALHIYSEIQERQRQDLIHQINAFVAEALYTIAERCEARVQIATAEAKSYSDDAAQVLVSGLRSQGRILAKHESLIVNLIGHSKTTLNDFRWETAQEIEKGVAVLDEQLRADYNMQLRNLEGRLEFVRREVLYELQARIMSSKSDESKLSRFKSHIKTPEKIRDRLADGLLLNIGCGHIILDGYINVDRRDLPGVDIVADAIDIPVEPGSVKEIIASHLIEHFSLRTFEDVVLPHWRSLLAPHGRLLLVAPDGAAMLQAVSNGSMPFEDFREVLFGGQEYEGDFHLNLVTTETVTSSLKRGGFGTVTVDYHSRRNGLCYEFQVTAERTRI